MADKHSNMKRVRVTAHVRRIRPRKAYHYPKVDVRLKPKLFAAVKAYCRAHNKTKSQLVRIALEDKVFVKREGTLPTGGEGGL